MFHAVRKHADPAIQAEIQNIYKVLNVLASLGSRRILTGKATFNGATGREIEIPYQDTTEYFVSISAFITETAFDEKTTITPGNAKFTVVSTRTSGEFMWVAII